MLDKKILYNLVGIQYKHLGRLSSIPRNKREVVRLNKEGEGLDCLGLMLLVYAEDGYNIPDYVYDIRYDQKWYRGNRSIYIEHMVQYFEKVSVPQFLDSILFKCWARIPNHLGIYMGDKFFIHSLENNSVAISRLVGYWDRVKYGYFRPKR